MQMQCLKLPLYDYLLVARHIHHRRQIDYNSTRQSVSCHCSQSQHVMTESCNSGVQIIDRGEVFGCNFTPKIFPGLCTDGQLHACLTLPGLKDVSSCGTSFFMHSSNDHMTTGQWHIPRNFTQSCVPICGANASKGFSSLKLNDAQGQRHKHKLLGCCMWQQAPHPY